MEEERGRERGMGDRGINHKQACNGLRRNDEMGKDPKMK
jgi:hypothetical protein